MTTDRWRRTEELFHAARARPPAERAAFLDAACAGDESMRRDVESLLQDAGSDDGFLAEPAVVLAAHVLPPPTSPMAGRSLGSYRLEQLIGAGGMGEVYRAHDTRLDRSVAIKILPAAFTDNRDRLARFEREARMLAALNHPNICAIHGVEESDGLRFLILEFVDGETLARRIANASPMPLGDVLVVAGQIAEALEAAHDRGIVHRDLKPANVSITPTGAVKVLDFGLAKAVAGDGSSPDLSNVSSVEGLNGGGAVVGTAAYMSPEQARGLTVDKRTDIWAFGCLLYEMLSGRRVFGGETVSDSIARILEREPDWSLLPAATPASMRQLLRRCLVKDPKQRLRDIGDAKIEIDEIKRSGVEPAGGTGSPQQTRRWTIALSVAAAAAVLTGVATWQAARLPDAVDPFANAQFTALTADWEGTEALADVSPDGRFVVFLSDRAGELDLWWTQVGTGHFMNLTRNLPPLDSPGVLRTFGFSGNGAEIWFGANEQPNMLMPQTGGEARPFLAADARALAWSGDGSRVAYFTLTGGHDPLSIADRTGGDARRIDIRPADAEEWSGVAGTRRHNHNPVWARDDHALYFVHGVLREWNHPSDEMDIWQVGPAGGAPERLTHLETAITSIAVLDSRTLLYIAPGEDGSGSWLWSFDLETRRSRRAVSGLEQFTSVSVSRDGSRVVATRANPTASLWTVPIFGGSGADAEAQPYVVDTKRALAPRFGGASLFYLSARGAGDGLWRVADGRSSEVHRGADGVLLQAPAPSPDGQRVAVVRRRDGRHLLTVMSANGTESRTLAPSLDAHGTPDWSPDGKWIATGAIDARGLGLFRVSVDDPTADPIRLAEGEAINPIWSPDGSLIVYAGVFGAGQAPLFAIRPDGTPVDFPTIRVSPGGYRFLPDGTGLVYLPRPESLDFWLLDLASATGRQLTRFANRGTIRRFDIAPGGTHIVFDRVQQNGDIVVIDRPKP